VGRAKFSPVRRLALARPPAARRDLSDLIESSAVLQERLRRLTLALAFTDEMVADTLDERLEAGGHQSQSRAESIRARARAVTCRELLRRLDELRAEYPTTASSEISHRLRHPSL
jgi:hypothetical protein